MSDLKYYGYFVLGKLKRQFFRAYPENEIQYKKSLICAIICNACSQTASSLATGTFLVLLMTRLGMSDGNMGLILTFHNFANLAQVISIKVSGRIVKNKLFVFVFEFQRILLGVLFFLPLFGWKDNVSAALLVIIYCFVQICVYVCNPAFIAWVDSLVSKETRGSYYALRQSVTMIAMLTASFVMGILVDILKEHHLNLLFVILGVSIVVLQAVSMITIFFMKEKSTSIIDESGHEVVGSLAKKRRRVSTPLENISVTQECVNAIRWPLFRKLLFIECLWVSGFALSSSFSTSYMLKELNLSYTLISAFSFVTCVIQSYLGPKFGKMADRNGTANITSGLVFLAAIQSLVLSLAIPSNGLVLFIISRILYAISHAFVSVGLFNLKLENFTTNKRIVQLSIIGIISGVFTYLICIIAGEFVDWFQAYALTKDRFIGYAQQYINALSFIILLVLAIYIRIIFNKKEGNE